MSEDNLSQLYHQYSKIIRKKIPLDDSLWPDEWKTVFYKTYPRLPKTKLSDKKYCYDLFEALKNRRSRRAFDNEKISSEELSGLLKYSVGTTVVELSNSFGARRVYPSGGGRYPIETYCLISRAGEGLKNGLFHYDVKNNQLEILAEKSFSQDELAKISNYPFAKKSACLIFLTATFWRTQNKYGERGYRFCLLEAGHIGQNIYLVSEALKLKCCALGGSRIADESAEKVLNIDGITESIVYALAVGK